ncbi:MAG: type II secretion system GspH family protein [Gemmatimonadota bacterium]|nr:type II secretion system GspH family protein [Gemmatimonadota bacterium]
MRRGYTLLEQLVVLTVFAILLTIVGPRTLTALDRSAVRNARIQLVSVLGAARGSAQSRAEKVSVSMDSTAGLLRILAGADTLLVRPLQTELGVAFAASRDNVTYGASGRGYGAANSIIVLSRGAAAETVYVARLGRARW